VEPMITMTADEELKLFRAWYNLGIEEYDTEE